MGVTFEVIDAPYPYVCAVYRCDCGACAARYADEAGSPPPGWQAEEAPHEQTLVHCPGCIAAARAAS
jgi:hypothetical protein